MKHYKKAFIFCLLLLTLPAALSALEVGAVFALENFDFTNAREFDETEFEGMNFLWGGAFFLRHTVADNVSLEAGFFRDTILRNISYTLINYNIQILSLGVGPFFGFLNSAGTIMKSGISTSVQLEFPGIAFLEFRSDNTIGGRLIEEGDYLQERNDISVGFYVYTAICSLNVASRKFTQNLTDSTGYEVVDTLVDY